MDKAPCYHLDFYLTGALVVDVGDNLRIFVLYQLLLKTFGK